MSPLQGFVAFKKDLKQKTICGTLKKSLLFGGGGAAGTARGRVRSRRGVKKIFLELLI
jgi:hypothetical protein